MTMHKTYSHICTNPNCERGLPHWKGFGKPSPHKCSACGRPMRMIEGEPRGTFHSMTTPRKV